MLEHWDHYAVARDSKFKWQAVQQWKHPKTFELEEKDNKLKKAEREAKQKQFNAPSGGKAKGYGRKYSSSGQSSSHRNKVERIYILLFICFYLFV